MYPYVSICTGYIYVQDCTGSYDVPECPRSIQIYHHLLISIHIIPYLVYSCLLPQAATMPCHWSLLAVLPQCWIKLPQQSSTEKRHHVFHSHSKPCKIIQNHSSYHRSTHGHSKPSETARSCPSIKYLPKQSVKHTRKTTVSAQWPKQVAQVHQHDNLQKSVHLNRGFGMLRIASDGFGLLTLCKMDRT